MDQTLGLNVVPRTKVVKLNSPSFHYTRMQRARLSAVRSASERFPDTVGDHCCPSVGPGLSHLKTAVQIGKKFSQELPLKIGSFQMFVRGFKVGSCARFEGVCSLLSSFSQFGVFWRVGCNGGAASVGSGKTFA